MRVSFTLTVLPTGLTADGLRVVQNAIANGVDIGQVDVMAMDYDDPAFDYSGKMGDLAIQAAQRVHDQLAPLYPSKSDTQVWAMVGVTPMIGVNDDPREVFTVADADKLTAFARQRAWAGLPCGRPTATHNARPNSATVEHVQRCDANRLGVLEFLQAVRRVIEVGCVSAPPRCYGVASRSMPGRPPSRSIPRVWSADIGSVSRSARQPPRTVPG